MNRDTVVYCSCTFLLGLVIGSFVVGPHLAKAGGAPPTATAVTAPNAAGAGGAPPNASPNPMDDVRRQIDTLKAAIERDPRNADALVKLGGMYMAAAKYPEAIGYFERALAIREEPNVLIDAGICFKETGQLDKALAAFRRSSVLAPDQWQTLFNEAIVLGEMRRFDEAKAIGAKLKAMRPDDPDVQRLNQALAAAR